MSEDIIRMAREADPDWDYDRDVVEWLARFAALVRAAEQDRCCRIIFGMAGSDNVAQRTVDAIRNTQQDIDNPSF